MWFYVPAIFLKRCQMCNLVYQRHKEPVFVETGIYRNLMESIRIAPVVAMPGNALIYYLKVYTIMLYQLKNQVESMFGHVWGKYMFQFAMESCWIPATPFR